MYIAVYTVMDIGVYITVENVHIFNDSKIEG